MSHRVVIADDGGVHLYNGEAVQVMREALEEESFDAVVTDPPYSSGGALRSDRMAPVKAKYVQTGTQIERPEFLGDHRDQRSYLAWSTLWMWEAFRLLKPGRPILVFSDWRQLPTTTDALQSAGFVWRGIVPWDKGRGTRPNLGFSAQAEYVVWGTRGPTDFGHEVYLPGVINAPVRLDEKHHMTGKPVGLMSQLLAVTPPGGVVLDPFAGSGTTLVAAREVGIRAVGVELSSAYCDVARKRLAQRSLFCHVDLGATS